MLSPSKHGSLCVRQINHVIARSEMGMSIGATWQSHAVQGDYASVRLLRSSQ
jgi:hypothetical protein